MAANRRGFKGVKEEIEGIPSPATIKIVRNKLKPSQREAGGLLKVGENAFDNAGAEQPSVHRTGTLYSVRYVGCSPGCCRPVPSVQNEARVDPIRTLSRTDSLPERAGLCMGSECHVAGSASPSTSVLKAASKGADPTFSGTKRPSIASMVMPWMSPQPAAA